MLEDGELSTIEGMGCELWFKFKSDGACDVERSGCSRFVFDELLCGREFVVGTGEIKFEFGSGDISGCQKLWL